MFRRVLASALLALLAAAPPTLAQGRARQWFTYEDAFENGGRGASQPGLQPLPQITGWLDGEHLSLIHI